jgi:hypothetical protein
MQDLSLCDELSEGSVQIDDITYEHDVVVFTFVAILPTMKRCLEMTSILRSAFKLSVAG